jgi:hypothetical protein
MKEPIVSVHRLFTHHPRSVGESYLQHQRHAFAFGATMIFAGLACILHGLVPVLFVTTPSRTVSRLYDRMVTSRSRLRPSGASVDKERIWPQSVRKAS